jgi:excisionase family DNA binding protein
MDQPRDFFVEKIADAVAERLARMHGRRVRILDLEAAAEYLSLSEDAVKDLVGAGKLSVVRPTRKIQFDVYDLDELIESLKSRREL